jgi:hypothetical protein
VLLAKFADAIAGHLPAARVARIRALASDPVRLDDTPVHEFMELFTL